MISNRSKLDISYSCLVPAIKPERTHQKSDLLEFLVKTTDKPKEALKNALNRYKIRLRLNAELIKTTRMRSLIINSNVYYWILKSYGPNSELTQICFDDILESRVWVDIKMQETSNRKLLEGYTTCAFNSVCSIYLEYCNGKVPFQQKHLQYLRLTNNDEILKPFFGISLPTIFDLQLREKLPLNIPYEFDTRPKVKSTTNKKWRNYANERKTWKEILEKEYNQIHMNNPDINDINENYKNMLDLFWNDLMWQEPKTKSSNGKRTNNNKQTIRRSKRLKK